MAVDSRTGPGDREHPLHVVGRAVPESGTRYSAREIHDTLVQAAIDELHRPIAALWWSALAAGLIISFSFLMSAFLSRLATSDMARWALASAGYPLGFVFVVLSSTQLFTEDTLDPILPLLEHPNADMFWRTVRLWAVVLAGNLAGTLLFGTVLARTPLVPKVLHPALTYVARQSSDGTFGSVFYRAIFGGWLVALMSWLVSTTLNRLAQIVLIWLTTAPIAALGFRHAIAGSVEISYLVARREIAPADALGHFLVPAVLGNAVGGMLLVALLFYGQVSSDKRARDRQRRTPP